jgi:hypothetical protein
MPLEGNLCSTPAVLSSNSNCRWWRRPLCPADMFQCERYAPIELAAFDLRCAARECQMAIHIPPRRRLLLLLTACAAVLPSGCASIVSGRHANVAIDTYPTTAHVTIHDKTGREVASVNTPAVVSLDRNSKWFMPAQYTATIEASGYQTTQVPIRSTINPWIIGNVVVGGIPGLIVDDATGACWKPQQDAIRQQLVPSAYAQRPLLVPDSQAAIPVCCPAPANEAAINSVATAAPPTASQPPAPLTTPAAEKPVNPAVASGPAGASPSRSFYR